MRYHAARNAVTRPRAIPEPGPCAHVAAGASIVMIVGTGMLATAFAPLAARHDLLVHAAGVSNSRCTDTAAFERERMAVSRSLDPVARASDCCTSRLAASTARSTVTLHTFVTSLRWKQWCRSTRAT